LLLEGQIPRVPTGEGRLTSRTRPWSEPSATTVWKTLVALGIAERTALWNAYPWHPHKPDNPHSNRTPSRTERQAGVPVLQAYLRLFRDARVFAVGRNAESSLAELGIQCTPLRHPSMGGAAEFGRQLRQAVSRASAR
jgi:uracil-DNA glycosylase